MTTPQPSETAESSLGRDLLYAARYYLGNRRVILALSSLAVVVSLYFGGWGWLVAAGLAPILLSTLPCLVMCVFGVCAMCRSNKTETTTSSTVVEPTPSQTALSVVTAGQTKTEISSCCSSPERPKASL